jgi:hypothetical protein
MSLGLIVSVVVVGVIAIVGATGYLIDRSAERHERTPPPL